MLLRLRAKVPAFLSQTEWGSHSGAPTNLRINWSGQHAARQPRKGQSKTKPNVFARANKSHAFSPPRRRTVQVQKLNFSDVLGDLAALMPISGDRVSSAFAAR